MGLSIRAISTYLPSETVTNDCLVERGRVPYSSNDIFRKTGIEERRVSSIEETPTWMGLQACQKLFSSGICSPDDINWLIFCTHTPDYMIPSCACILHGLLGLNENVGAFDIALSCTGFVYSLVVCDGLLRINKSQKIILVNSDNYTKYLDPSDANVCTIFGDAATATLIEFDEKDATGILGYKLCTEGKGYDKLIRRGGGATYPFPCKDSGKPSDPYIRMDGPEIFRFAQKTIPAHINCFLSEINMSKEDVDYFLLHQASDYMLRSINQRLGVTPEKLPIKIRYTGNTISASIPLLMHAMGAGEESLEYKKLLLCGFGAGLSYGSVLLRTGVARIDYL